LERGRSFLVAAFFAFFVLSGFSGLVYQVVWLRLAMACFGVTSPMVAVVVSVFMAGLGLGSWIAGRLAGRLRDVPRAPFLLYAGVEASIGASVVAVPIWLERGRAVLAGTSAEWGSLAHYLTAGAWITVGLLPFCTAMGMTFPLAIWALSGRLRNGAFGFLYIANVSGACVGTLVSAYLLIELFGFRGTLVVAGAGNALIAIGALLLSRLAAGAGPPAAVATGASGARAVQPWTRTILFTTGFASMGMEVVWVRQFTPYLGTVVYAFATILALYLAATAAGTLTCRLRERRQVGRALTGTVWAWLGFLALLPLLSVDPRLPVPTGAPFDQLRLLVGLAPLSLALGFITPLLVDRYAGDDPDRAGSAYAVNILGCILGPLAAGFVLLPWLGDRGALLLLALPLVALTGLMTGRRAIVAIIPAAAVMTLLVVTTRDFETQFPVRMVLRDHTATVTATGTGMRRLLLVNGVGMTMLTPDTKVMAHLPAVFHEGPPRRALVICFGMGTSFRSLLSWGADTTAVELVPSVPALFGYFHADAETLLASSRAHVVVDDGRRFLERSRERFDVIVVDPPPPFQAAGTSLLYSTEFLTLVRRRLAPGGVLQHWLPAADPTGAAAATRALLESFPNLRAFRSLESYGLHFLASEEPLPQLSAAELAQRLPAPAVRDLLEWGPCASAEEQLARVLSGELRPHDVVARDPSVPPISDNRPVNEYYFLRSHLRGRQGPTATGG
jgi:spermidine synthase